MPTMVKLPWSVIGNMTGINYRGRACSCGLGTSGHACPTVPNHEEYCQVEGRRTWLEAFEEMHALLGDDMVVFSGKRTHERRDINGRTLWYAFQDRFPARGNPRRVKQNEETSALWSRILHSGAETALSRERPTITKLW